MRSHKEAVVTLIVWVLISLAIGCMWLYVTGDAYGMEYFDKGSRYALRKAECEDAGKDFSGDINNPESWECEAREKPTAPPVVEPTVIVAPSVQPSDDNGNAHSPVAVTTPQPCISSDVVYCGGGKGFRFNIDKFGNRGKVTFVVSGLTTDFGRGVPGKFIFWMEGRGDYKYANDDRQYHKYFYNSVVWEKNKHRHMFNNVFTENAVLEFDPSVEYTFVVAWDGGVITQRVFDGDRLENSLSALTSANIAHVSWIGIGEAAHGSRFADPFVIKHAEVSYE